MRRADELRSLLAWSESGPSAVQARAEWLADVDSPEEWRQFQKKGTF